MGQQITRSVIVKGDVSHIYGLWENFETFPNFMSNIAHVEYIDEQTTHWLMEGPLSSTFKWTAETTVNEPNKRIAWNSKDDDGDLVTSGQVTFNELPDEQTEVTVTIRYDPPAGIAGEVAAVLFANPEQRLTEDLRNFKAFAERRAEAIRSGS